MAAWDNAGIFPFNPRRVLNPLASSPIKKPASFPVSGPTTPRTTRMARSTAKQALCLVKCSSESARELRNLINQMDKGLQISITEREIVDHISTQFRKSVAKKPDKAKTADRKLLSRVRVITTEDVLKLREARDAADAVKIAKAEAKEAKKKAKEDSSTLDKHQRGRSRQVKLSENVTVYSIETLNNEGED
jgi:hypothetical protein